VAARAAMKLAENPLSPRQGSSDAIRSASPVTLTLPERCFVRLASIAVDDELGIKVISVHGRQTVCVRVTRITAQHLAHALLAYSAVRRRRSGINSKVTYAGEDLTPPHAGERAVAQQQASVRHKKHSVVRL
jgi:hypothetical protein